jgi:hypothetical protein
MMLFHDPKRGVDVLRGGEVEIAVVCKQAPPTLVGFEVKGVGGLEIVEGVAEVDLEILVESVAKGHRTADVHGPQIHRHELELPFVGLALRIRRTHGTDGHENREHDGNHFESHGFLLR